MMSLFSDDRPGAEARQRRRLAAVIILAAFSFAGGMSAWLWAIAQS